MRPIAALGVSLLVAGAAACGGGPPVPDSLRISNEFVLELK
jgi:hypothetical protein